MSLIYSPSATATVAANSNAVTIAGMDISVLKVAMTLHLGARDRVTGDGLIITSVTPNAGASGGTLTTLGAVSTAYTNAAFVVDTRGYNGQSEVLKVAASYEAINTLARLTSPNTNLYGGSRLLWLDKTLASNVSSLAFAIGGQKWAELTQRTLTYTPTGGSAVTTEILAVTAYPTSSTSVDALTVDLSTGGVDFLSGSATITVSGANSTADLGSAPARQISLGGSGSIASFGPARRKERLITMTGVLSLVHSATLILPGGANITTAVGDTFLATASDVAGVWRVRDYQRASGPPIGAAPTNSPVFTGTTQAAALQVAGLSVYGSAIYSGGAADNLDIPMADTRLISVDFTARGLGHFFAASGSAGISGGGVDVLWRLTVYDITTGSEVNVATWLFYSSASGAASYAAKLAGTTRLFVITGRSYRAVLSASKNTAAVVLTRQVRLDILGI